MPAYPGAPRCFSCNQELARDVLNTTEPVPCVRCSTPLQGYLFPAQFRATAAPTTEAALEEDSTCFYHPDKRAAVCCDNCGRFVCNLCDIDFDGKHLCPGCLNNAPTKTIQSSLENEGFNYDWFAIILAFFGPFFCCCLTGPATCYVVIRYWNSFTPFSNRFWYRARMVIALIVGLLSTILGIFNVVLQFYTIAKITNKDRVEDRRSFEAPDEK